MEKEIQQQLSHLKQTVEKVKSLHAWKELKDWERNPDRPPAFQIFDPVNDDLNIEVNYFVSRAMELHRQLKNRKEEWAVVVRNQLIAMEREIATIKTKK